MISICIPIYNTDCNKLVDDLLSQINALKVEAEIICVDDKSNENYRILNQALKNKCNYKLLEKNIGRSKIRNSFLHLAKYDWLLFLDSDAIICNELFISNYINFITENKSLVATGGTHFLKPSPFNNENSLAYNYLNKNEEKRDEVNKENEKFITKNFIINKSIFKTVCFYELLIKYGHEDTLFGFELKQNGVKVLHLNNKVCCVADDNNLDFLSKLEDSISNLHFLINKIKVDKAFIQEVSLLQFYYKYKSIFFLTSFLHPLLQNTIYKQLLKGKYSSYKLNLYKALVYHKKIN